MVHTGFNVINTCIFLPFLGYFSTLVRRLVPDTEVKEQPHLTMLDTQRMAPAMAVEQARITSYNVCYTKLLRRGRRHLFR